VPRLGQHCKTAAPGELKTLDDLHAFLLLLAEEHSHEADKAKSLLTLAQQVGVSTHVTVAANASSGTAGQQHPAEATQLLQRSRADLAAARIVIQKHEQLLQKQLQESAQLREQLRQQQLQAAGVFTGPSIAGSCQAEAVHALAVRGDSCGVLPGVELGGDVVIWGAEHKTTTAAACCAACLAHSGAVARGVGSEAGKAGKPCNVWVHCSDAAGCGSRYQECWLKHDANAASTAAAAAAATAASLSMWTSGVSTQGQPAAPWQALQLGLPSGGAFGEAVLTSSTTPVLVWSTAMGQIRVQLLPELAPGSVRELLRMGALLAVASNGHCSNCRVYRAERGFLVQGVLETAGAYVAVPRHPNPPQRKVMQRGLVCWAGGGGGPDWFVNMVDQAGFGDQHLCFGQVDAAGLAVFEHILELPVKPKGGADSVEMTLLQQDLRFNFTLQSPTTLG